MPASLGFPGSGWGPEDHSLMTLGSGQPSQMVLDASCLLSSPCSPFYPDRVRVPGDRQGTGVRIYWRKGTFPLGWGAWGRRGPWVWWKQR